MRTTKKEVEAVFKQFCEDNDFKIAESAVDVGGYTLDYAACYGGYVINRISNDGGGVSQPFGYMRRGAKELVDCLRFANDVNYIATK